jgi:hypothetical protein
MSDSQRIRGLGGINNPAACRMPGLAGDPGGGSGAASGYWCSPGFTASGTDKRACEHNSRPYSRIATKTCQRAFYRGSRSSLLFLARSRLPLDLVEELEAVAALHAIPMVAIVTEAVKLHLTRFPRRGTVQCMVGLSGNPVTRESKFLPTENACKSACFWHFRVVFRRSLEDCRASLWA